MPAPFPQPNYPSPIMNQAMGTSEFGDDQEIQASTDAEESAIAYIEASIAMLKNAKESLPALDQGVKQIAQFINYVLRQTLQANAAQQQQGPQQPPEVPMGAESSGPEGPTAPPQVPSY